MSPRSANAAFLPTAAALFCFSAGPVGLVVQRYLVASFDPSTIVALQMTVGAAVLWIVRASLPRRVLPVSAYGKGLALGMVHPGGFMIVYAAASARLDSITAVLAVALAPGAVALLGRLALKEPLKPVVLVGLAVSFAGMVLLVSDRDATGENQLSGILLAAVGLSLAAGGVVIGRALNTGAVLPWFVLAPLQVSGAGLVAWVGVFLFGPPVSLGPVLADWAAFAYLALGMTAASYFAYNFALSRLPTPQLGLLAAAGPGVGAIAAAIIFDQSLSNLAILGIGVVLFGAALPSLKAILMDRRHRGAPSPASGG